MTKKDKKKVIKDKLGAPSEDKNNQIRRDAIDSILEKGVDFTITIQNKNILHKLNLIPAERKFIIFPIRMGTLLKISKILLDLDTDELVGAMKDENKEINLLDLGAKNIIENKDKMIKMIAYGIVNSEKEPPKSLIRFLNENLTAKEGLKLMTLIVQQMDVNPFLASLVSIKGMNLLQNKKKATPGE
ncbi:hypothetical protein ES695_06370 [Candidatus Atribacteria bacterium 1244-E10-H5-B2]|nr:MAG: hypothetical protein ES695_06370 [Candidatus Atribacteria bacterium 1244-E10-H5-B2]